SDQSGLQLQEGERLRFLDELDGPIYEKTRVRLPLMLRLDAALSAGGATYDHGVVSVEHVLPQNPQSDGPWASLFDDEAERLSWTHRIANLVLLTRAKNNQAGNWDFDRKKSGYFSTKAGMSSFRLTSMVLTEKVWDRATLARRQGQLLKKLS